MRCCESRHSTYQSYYNNKLQRTSMARHGEHENQLGSFSPSQGHQDVHSSPDPAISCHEKLLRNSWKHTCHGRRWSQVGLYVANISLFVSRVRASINSGLAGCFRLSITIAIIANTMIFRNISIVGSSVSLIEDLHHQQQQGLSTARGTLHLCLQQTHAAGIPLPSLLRL